MKYNDMPPFDKFILICMLILLGIVILGSIQTNTKDLHTMQVEEAHAEGLYTPEVNPQGERHPDLELVSGGGTKERTAAFVSQHCTTAIIEVWEQAYHYAESQGIRGYMPFVIAWADSQCGKHLSTPNNPGNVNNNDRGNRVGFFTMLEGLNAITDTLNNKYMGGIDKIGHLSQGGRNEIGSKYGCRNAPAPWKCYATSEWNWNKNVTRALSVVYGNPVDASHEFRI